ncbi:alcohol dehydrogenase catalytic domain-containing protein [Motilibacter peucedani]|nr:alcohol dehydrogenase catalytic domain-containing protein [Motilibacter peucedani]
MDGATMPAVRWHARGDVRVEQVPAAPAPGAGEVRVRVAFCGICGSDVHEYLHGPFTIPTRPHPTTGAMAPIVLGHEVSGWVDTVGSGVSGLAVGDVVALNALLPCGRCPQCAAGAPHLCLQLGHIGMSADGGLAEALTVPAAMVVAAPPGMAPQLAALGEPFAVALHALRLAGSPVGRRCTVVGSGTIGLCVALLLVDAGNEVTVLDVAEERLAHAASLGLDARPVDEGVRGGASVVLECSGAAPAVSAAVGLAEPGGTVVLLGLPERPVELDVTDVVLREVHVVGSMSHLADADLAPALAFLARNAELAAKVVTAVVPLDAAVSGGLEALVGSDRARHAKILVAVGA